MTTRHRQLLFVCTGNICRSPMAEYLLRHHLGPQTDWQIGSAGLAALNGMPASESALEGLGEQKIDLAPHRSRALTREMIDKADLIVVMTASHAREINRRFPTTRDRVRLLKSFARAGGDGDIQDPIGSDPATYRRIRDEINEALLDLILYLKHTKVERK
jgi:protein-tyrosine phosphatase